MAEPKGWMCPQCGKAHGPHIDTCPTQTVKQGGAPLRHDPAFYPWANPPDFYPPIITPVRPWPSKDVEWTAAACRDPNIVTLLSN